MCSFFKNSKTFLLVGGMLIALYSCKKNDNNQPATVPQHGTIHEKGTPVGEAVHATIGPAGGTLTTTDGRMKLEVPAGAVTKETDFTIQPVTNTLPGSPGNAYRLLPEGQTFTKPVTLSFHYNDNDLEGTAVQVLFLAFQSNDGIWRCIPQTALDETAHTLTAKTTHFSDWAPFAEFWLNVANHELKPKGSTTVDISSPFLLAPLGKDDPLEIADTHAEDNPKNIKNWQIFQDGKLTVESSNKRAHYTAPDQIPGHNPVQVSVEIYNFIPAGYVRPGATGKAVLMSNIYIVDETYFTAEIDGIPYTLNSIFYTMEDGKFIINGNLSATTSIMLVTNGANAGFYPFTVDENAGTGIAVYNGGAGNGYVHNYTPCASDPIASPGGIAITKTEKSGDVEYLEGSFSATVYKEEGICPNLVVRHKNMKGRFRVIRKI
ncbi:hypothetical protein HGH93_09860 [Chitinophaga polysaccharea]|uniref:hypothetical protein n=1 Tax=Chitinophaga polysaccharea TaxID=1293035 RepID=UPI0014559D1C|nr:hypothetical protein [Chitinophaga polysaccharea]NLR58404.1 hypothetical protein [Chitinophaga polysaccharea]